MAMSEKPRFVEFSILTGDERILERVRLIGDDWYIEVRPTEDGIEVIGSGNIAGNGQLLVMPKTANMIRITNDSQHECAAHALAARLVEVDKSNREFWKSKGKSANSREARK